MSTQAVDGEPTDVPLDTFAVRLAVVRAAMGGWNITKAARECGQEPESWRQWEKGRKPHNREEVCRAIQARTGWRYEWLMAGGPLRSRCLTSLTLLPALPGQTQLAFDEPAALTLV